MAQPLPTSVTMISDKKQLLLTINAEFDTYRGPLLSNP